MKQSIIPICHLPSQFLCIPVQKTKVPVSPSDVSSCFDPFLSVLYVKLWASPQWPPLRASELFAFPPPDHSADPEASQPAPVMDGPIGGDHPRHGWHGRQPSPQRVACCRRKISRSRSSWSCCAWRSEQATWRDDTVCVNDHVD